MPYVMDPCEAPLSDRTEPLPDILETVAELIATAVFYVALVVCFDVDPNTEAHRQLERFSATLLQVSRQLDAIRGTEG